MQVNEEGCGVGLLVEISAGAVNLLLILAFYVANANFSTAGFAKTGFGVFAEMAFVAGLIGLCVLIVTRGKIRSKLSRYLLILVVTAWNQACLVAFLASIIPFKLT